MRSFKCREHGSVNFFASGTGLSFKAVYNFGSVIAVDAVAIRVVAGPRLGCAPEGGAVPASELCCCSVLARDAPAAELHSPRVESCM